MQYVMIIEGYGEGCDYGIDCNKAFEVFSADTDDAAIQFAIKNSHQHYGYNTIEKVYLFRIDNDITKDFETVFNKHMADIKNRAIEREKQRERIRDEALYEQLKQKLGK